MMLTNTASRCDICIHDSMLTECKDCSEFIRVTKFKERPNPLCNLFRGAPVMVRTDENQLWTSRFYDTDNRCFPDGTTRFSRSGSSKFWRNIRLPNISESPVNTWLATPPGNCVPCGAAHLQCMIWVRNQPYPQAVVAHGEDLGWTDVDRFMIIGG